MTSAPVNTVAQNGGLAVGINPPDAAQEWTAEEQAAEAARLAGNKKEATEQVAAGDGTAAVAKKPRGRPAGATAAVVAGAYTVDVALTELDGIGTRLLAAGLRNEAMQVLGLSAQLAA
jgi:hypothetical protein